MDAAAHAAGTVLLDAHSLYARTNTTTPSTPSDASRPGYYKIIGLSLAVASGLFIGVSFVLKKKGLLKANEKYHEEAGEGYGYLKNGFWWTGMTLMIIGEICNFVAYAFVDAILVTPLGALSVVVTTILSAIFLKERLSFVGKVGCFNCIVGSVVIVVNAPQQSSVADIQQMQHFVIAPGFLSYAGVIIVGCIFVALWVAPRYGKKNMLVYLTICSLIGGLSVVATQGLGSAIVAQAGGMKQFNQWFLYVLFVFVVCTLLTEIIYLNKALNLFNAALVTPTYYVYFTTATIVTSAVLFRGFHGTASQIATVIFGFLQICSGVVLLQLSKSSKDVPDSAVFSGDLDQVRTVAEQKEPEWEPRADTIRAGGSIIRSMSKIRTSRQMEEMKRMKTEMMEPIGENEQVEWDGLRRRKTVLEPNSKIGTLQRRKTIHPPLGMSEFPDDASQATTEDDVHPGVFDMVRRGSTKVASWLPGQRPASTRDVKMQGLTSPTKDVPTLAALTTNSEHSSPQDTSYKGSHIQWSPEEQRSATPGPPPPPHSPGAGKRQFSFQNPFHRGSKQPDEELGIPRSKLSFKSPRKPTFHPGDGTTEEERLGLVEGDNPARMGRSDSPPENLSRLDTVQSREPYDSE